MYAKIKIKGAYTMEFINNLETYYEYLKMYFVGSSVLLVLMFMIILALSSKLSRIERKINYLLGDVADLYDDRFMNENKE